MNALVIEDSDLKFKLVEAFLHELDLGIATQRAPGYRSGVEVLVKSKFDFVILDMTLPVFDAAQCVVNSDMLTFGGEFILRECQRRRIDAKFIVLSQYDSFVRDDKEVTFAELRAELIQRYGNIVLGCVRLDSTSVLWKAELKALIIQK